MLIRILRSRFWFIPVVFGILGVAWIFGSDWLLGRMHASGHLSGQQVGWLQTIKEVTYLLTSSAVLYVLLRAFYGRLQRSESEYRDMFDLAPIPRLIVDSESGLVKRANVAAQNWYQLSREELRQNTVSSLHICPENGGPTPLPLQANGKPMIWQLDRKHDGEAYAQVFLQPIRYDEVTATQITLVPITAQVEAERQASAASAEMGRLLENITDAFFSVDRAWRLRYVNATFERITHTRRGDLIGRVLWEVFPGLDDTDFYARYHEAMAGGESVHFDAYYPTLELWLRVTAYPSQNGLWGFFQDITEERRERERVAESERNYKAVINATEDAIWYIDRQGHILFHNSSYARLRGQGTDHKQNYQHALRPDSVPEQYKAGQELLWSEYELAFKGELRRFEHAMPMPDGGMLLMEITLNPVVGAEGAVEGLGCFAHDVTNRHAAQQRIVDQNERLKKIAWFQSHLVRGPVASILGLALVFDRKHPGTEFNLEVIDHVDHMAKKLDEVIKSIVTQASGETFNNEDDTS